MTALTTQSREESGKEFEAWVVTTGWDSNNLKRLPSGAYCFPAIQYMWLAWSAREDRVVEATKLIHDLTEDRLRHYDREKELNERIADLERRLGEARHD